ncbi:MAG: tRNA 2-thiocytidine(32) synthetase TtcA [Deltaproteobacteria bacterium]|nr:tRNA 2-thiocytidine(32) synthetase TtcA [Deltaproteobacteria bacterium]
MRHVAEAMKRLMGKAIHSRDMIKEGDHILVAVSGGKDSLSLLWLLKERCMRVPISYKVTAVHVDPGFSTQSGERMEAFFAAHGFDHRVIKSDFGPLAHSAENRENPCFLCSRLRRKRLFESAAALSCNKIALGHHKDDFIETFFLNIFYGASISTMAPVQPLFDGKICIIRPLFMIDQKMIKRYADWMGWPEIPLGCPTAGASKREEIKTMLDRFYKNNKKVKGNIFHALQNIRPESFQGWMERKKELLS